jgi:hypothetical protein
VRVAEYIYDGGDFATLSYDTILDGNSTSPDDTVVDGGIV